MPCLPKNFPCRLALRLAAVAALLPSAYTAVAQTPLSNLLMPQPAQVRLSPNTFRVEPSITLALAQTRSPRLQAAALRFLKRLEDKSGTPLLRSISAASSGSITVEVAKDGAAVQGLNEDESYTLRVTSTDVHLKAATTTGALHGLETLLQLTQPNGNGYVIQAAEIDDNPRFRWRGLMIDCSRHFEPLDVLKRNIDAMAAVKLNVFHWHLTDDQGFRIESKIHPKLTALGSDGLFYTQEQARELVAYARDRGIRVVPEFEMPGHSAAWLVAYPELNSGTQPDGIRREFGISDTAVDPTREETYTFIAAFLKEMATIFPDEYLHIGGDETPAPDWKTNPRIVAFMRAHNLKDNDALQAYFNTRVLKIVSGLNRRMVGWDEIMNPDLPRDIVIQSWRGAESLAKGAQMGFAGVLSQPYYLDAMKSASVHYLADPVPSDTKLTPDQQKLILGGEVCMWAEQIDQRTVASRVWPRTAAIAERFWSPQQVRNVDDMYRRLDSVAVEIESLGLRNLSSEDAGLRSLVNSPEIGPLHDFARAFEPVPFGGRYQEQHTSQLTPLTSFVDAVVPDPPIKHQVERMSHALAQNPQDADSASTLRAYYQSLRNSIAPVQGMMAQSPRLQPMADRAQQLLRLSTIGMEATQYLTHASPTPPNWKKQSLAELEAAKKPSAIVRFVFQDSLTELVNAVR